MMIISPSGRGLAVNDLRMRGELPMATPSMTYRSYDGQNDYRRRVLPKLDSFNVSQGARLGLIRYSLLLYCQFGNLAHAILQKAEYCVGSAFIPRYYTADKKWNDAAEQWLVEKWFPTCNVEGPDFQESLVTDSIGLDVLGDVPVILTKGNNGWPMFKKMNGCQIGSREDDPETVKSGCVQNKEGRTIGYKFLGEEEKDDKTFSTFDCQLLMEHEFDGQIRGLPGIAKAILDGLDIADIDDYLKRGVKLDTSVGLLKHTQNGMPPSDNPFDEATSATSVYSAPYEAINGGDIYYLNSNANENITAFDARRPTTGQENFIGRIERRFIHSVRWYPELLDPSKIGGASVRLIQDQVRSTIRQRQKTLQKRAKRVINYAVAVAIKLGELPANEEWFKFNLQMPAQITVDEGYSRAADVEDLKLGIKSESDIAASHGRWFEDTRGQRKTEVILLLDDASEVAKKYNIPLQSALDLLQQRNPNPTPIIDNKKEAA